ncbi:hypothetical protein KKA23_02000 [Patescibacteria group bacterium]|nr:hypothetical protein [Patescibacteria group bacterium]
MPDYINEFRKKVSQLPPKIKEAMLSDKTTELISVIDNKYKLNAKQSDKLPILVGKIFVKEISLEDFVNSLKAQLNFESKTAKLITIDIAKNIFIPIKEYFPAIEKQINQLKEQQNLSDNPNIIDLKKT